MGPALSAILTREPNPAGKVRIRAVTGACPGRFLLGRKNRVGQLRRKLAQGAGFSPKPPEQRFSTANKPDLWGVGSLAPDFFAFPGPPIILSKKLGYRVAAAPSSPQPQEGARLDRSSPMGGNAGLFNGHFGKRAGGPRFAIFLGRRPRASQPGLVAA